MFKHYITSKYFLLLSKTILVIVFLLLVHFCRSSGLIHGENLNQNKNLWGNDQTTYAEFIDAEFFDQSDTSSRATNKGDNSDLFYYVLGIIILIAAGFILKQRYEQYLKQHDNL
jgi:hypothetical protein